MRIFPITLSFLSGFLSLSSEILWMRLMGYSHVYIAETNGIVLGFFLAGVALGARFGKKFCSSLLDNKRKLHLYRVIAGAFFISGIIDSLVFIVSPFQPNLNILLLFLSSFSKAIIFPLAHHLGSSIKHENSIGRSVSSVYFCNILGSTFGPLLTGFFLLDYVSLSKCFLLLSFSSIFIALIILITTHQSSITVYFKRKNKFLSYHINKKIIIISLLVFSIPLFITKKNGQDFLLEKIFIYSQEHLNIKPTEFIQNKSGIISIAQPNDGSAPYIFGGLVYDGRINYRLNEKLNSNMIERAYILAAAHPHPKKILVIGLSGGSWLKVITGLTSADHIDVVEINPGFFNLINKIPEYRVMFEDKRIHFYTDDARQWLRRTSNKEYDLVVMNTTFHWRMYSSNLLSKEFFSSIKQHMKKDGIISLNTTNLMDVIHTLGSIFNHAYLYRNFAYAGDENFMNNIHKGGIDRIMSMRFPNGEYLVPNNERATVENYLNAKAFTLKEIQSKHPRNLEVITDQNMLPEFKERVF